MNIVDIENVNVLKLLDPKQRIASACNGNTSSNNHELCRISYVLSGQYCDNLWLFSRAVSIDHILPFSIQVSLHRALIKISSTLSSIKNRTPNSSSIEGEIKLILNINLPYFDFLKYIYSLVKKKYVDLFHKMGNLTLACDRSDLLNNLLKNIDTLNQNEDKELNLFLQVIFEKINNEQDKYLGIILKLINKYMLTKENALKLISIFKTLRSEILDQEVNVILNSLLKELENKMIEKDKIEFANIFKCFTSNTYKINQLAIFQTIINSLKNCIHLLQRLFNDNLGSVLLQRDTIKLKDNIDKAINLLYSDNSIIMKDFPGWVSYKNKDPNFPEGVLTNKIENMWDEMLKSTLEIRMKSSFSTIDFLKCNKDLLDIPKKINADFR
jgi:hypothetical protein